LEESALKDEMASGSVKKVSRSELIELLNQDLAREYQAIIDCDQWRSRQKR
jgi:hypothetical protein